MTTAGLASIIICQNRLWRARVFGGSLRAETRRAVRDALAWLQLHFYVDHNPGWGGHWHGYYLYGLERAGILGRFRFVGPHDWYHRGAEHILKTKMYLASHGVDACFTLLFLKRATSRMDAPVITPSGGPNVTPVAMPPTAVPRWMRPDPNVPRDATLAAGYWMKRLKHRDGNVTFKATIELGRLANLATAPALISTLRIHQDAYVRAGAAIALGKMRAADAFRPLTENLLDEEDLVRHAANQALVRITQHKALTYRSSMTANDRMRLLKAWRAWWETHETQVRSVLKQAK